MRKTLDLFGRDAKWTSSEWTSSDDRVRGGKSKSHLKISESGKTATFSGNLDIKTLGGAGFASQRTASDDRVWDLSDYDGIEVVVLKADGKRYTFNIKDELLPRDPDTGREQSTISYEYDFKIYTSGVDSKKRIVLWIPWKQLTATYRGREKSDAPKLNTSNIKRFGIMCRSFFGDQEGDFALEIERITAVRRNKEAEKLDQSFPAQKDLEQGYRALAEDNLPHSRNGAKLLVALGVVAAGIWLLSTCYPATWVRCRRYLTGI